MTAMRNTLAAILVLIALSGCEEVTLEQRRDNFNQRIQSHVGQNVADLMEKWGMPASKNELPNGHTLYEWVRSDKRAESNGGAHVGAYGGSSSYRSDVYTAFCNVRAAADEAGKVVKVSWAGNACF